MTLSNVAAVRLKISDQPAFAREGWTADGATSEVRLGGHPVLTTPTPRVWLNGTLQTVVVNYTIDYANGIVTFVALPAVNAAAIIEYSSTVYSDEEIEQFLTEAGSSTTLAAALAMLAWSASAAKLAKKETLSNSGGLVTLDLAVRAREMRESAKAFFEQYEKYENMGQPAESITEIAWTEQMAQRMTYNWLLDELY